MTVAAVPQTIGMGVVTVDDVSLEWLDVGEAGWTVSLTVNGHDVSACPAGGKRNWEFTIDGDTATSLSPVAELVGLEVLDDADVAEALRDLCEAVLGAAMAQLQPLIPVAAKATVGVINAAIVATNESVILP